MNASEPMPGGDNYIVAAWHFKEKDDLTHPAWMSASEIPTVF